MSEIDRLSLDFASRHPEAFARVLGRSDFEDSEEVFERLPADRKAAIAARLPSAHIQKLLDSERHRPAEWLVDAPFGDAVALLSRLPREQRLALVQGLQDRERQRQLLRNQQYPAHSVGALVSDIPLCIGVGALAADVLSELRQLDTEAQGPVVIVDSDKQFLGILDWWRLLLQNPVSGSVREYLITVKPVHPETPVIAAAANDEWHTRNWLPVVDHRQRVLGAVSRGKVLRAAEVQSTGRQQSGDALLLLVADAAYFFETLLLKALSGKRSA